MAQGSLDDMRAFAAVARTRSFTRAAAELGVSTSALSYTIKRLEAELNTRLLQRNSRSVAPTEAGDQLLRSLEPALVSIDGAIEQIGRQRDLVSGTVRLTTTRQAYEAVLQPMLGAFTSAHPEARVEVMIDYELRNIIEERFDAGIRLGERVEQDMIALRLGPELRMAVVASPEHLEAHGYPSGPEDIIRHRCIGYRVKSSGPILSWDLSKDGRELSVRIDPFFVVNEMEIAIEVALKGQGIAFVLEDRVARHLQEGTLVRLLPDWTPSFPGWFLYYPSRRQTPPVLSALIAALRATRPA